MQGFCAVSAVSFALIIPYITAFCLVYWALALFSSPYIVYIFIEVYITSNIFLYKASGLQSPIKSFGESG